MVNMKKILVTGSLGYIGSVLTEYLMEKGYNCSGYDIGFFKDCLLCKVDDRLTVIDDMCQFKPEILDGIDTVVHLAGISNDPFGDLMPEKVYDSSRDYSLRLAKICKNKGIKFIFPSSCSIYGIGPDYLIDENSMITPQTPYSVNKQQIESDLINLSDNDFKPMILRFSTLFGLSPRMRFDIVINMLTAMAFTTGKILLNSDGKAYRPFVHIEDICEIIEKCIEYNNKNEISPFVVNVGSTSQNFQIIQVAKMIKSIVKGSKIIFLNHHNKFNKEEELIRDRKVQDGVDTRTYQVSFERLKQVFNGFECKRTVEQGIEQMLNHFKKINLTETEFKHIKFYRLQWMEHLYMHKKISNELKFI